MAVVRDRAQQRQIVVGQPALLGAVPDRLQVRLRRLPLRRQLGQRQTVRRIGDLLVRAAGDQVAVGRFDFADQRLVDVDVNALLAAERARPDGVRAICREGGV